MERKRQPVWVIYACTLCLGFSRTVAEITGKLGMSVQEYFLLAAILIIGVLLIVYLQVKLMVFRFQRISLLLRNRKVKITLIVSMAALTILVMSEHVINPPAGALIAGQGSDIRRSAYGFSLSDLYQDCLSLFKRFFNTKDTAFYFNLSLQTISVFFLIASACVETGLICLFAGVIMILCGPCYATGIYAAEPQSFLLFLFSITLFLCIFLMKKFIQKENIHFITVMSVLGGIAVCITPISLSLIWICAVLLFHKSVRSQKSSLAMTGFYHAMSALSFMLCLAAASIINGVDLGFFNGFGENFRSWLLVFSDRRADVILHSVTLKELWMTIPFYAFAFFGLLEMPEARNSNPTIWVIPFAFQTAVDFLSNAPLQEQGMRMIFLSSLSGFGILEMLQIKEDTDMKVKDVSNQISEIKTETDSLKTAVEPENETAGPRPGEYLSNPLPVPKRHVRKEMTYGFEPDPDQMFYEIPVADNDDFDLKDE